MADSSVKPGAKKGTRQVRLYRLYNWQVSRDGEPFALCDGCKPEQPVPAGCILNCIANGALQPWEQCGYDP